MVAALVFIGCAQVSAPTGGPADSTPPQVVRMSPANESLNVKPTELRMEFDEFVVLKNPVQQLVVSPPLAGKPEWKVRGKEVTLVLDPENFLSDRTYVFSFGSAIVDLHEGNPAEDLKWAFSTGPNLDTLSIRGRVVDRMTREGKSGLRVLLYRSPAVWDSIWAGQLPDAMGMTNANGGFSIGYLPDAAFVGFALDDGNGDYRWSPGEYIALNAAELLPGAEIEAWLGTPTEGPVANAGIGACRADSSGFIRVVAPAAPAMQETWTAIAGGEPMNSAWERSGDSVVVWVQSSADFDWDRLELAWQSGDRRDTAKVRMAPPVNSMDWTPLFKPAGTLRAGDERRWQFSRGIRLVDPRKFTLEQDTIQVDAFEVIGAHAGEFSRVFELNFEEQHGSHYRLRVFPGGLESTEGWPLNDTLQWEWDCHPREHFGDLTVALKDLPGPGWFRMEGERLRVENDTTLTFQRLLPGNVVLGFEWDENADFIWQSASPTTLQAAEPYFCPQNQPVIRSNWSIEWEWSLSPQELKGP